jgi:tetratricopeptide (TPR) repeat protein
MRLKLILRVLVMVAIVTPVCGQQTVEEWLAEGRIHLNQGKYDKAVTATDEVIELDPGGALSWAGKSSALYGGTMIAFNEGVFDEAMRASDEAMRAFDEAMRAFDEAMRAFDEAMRAFDEAMRAFDEAMRAFDEAMECYEKAFKIYSDWHDRLVSDVARE